MQNTATDTVATDETGHLIASDKVAGTAVYNRAGESLGTIANFLVNKHSGTVEYVIMSFGGFLGMGEKYHPLPWKALNYDPGMSGYVVDLDKSRLEGAPTYERSEAPDWGDPGYGRRIDDFYGPFPGL